MLDDTSQQVDSGISEKVIFACVIRLINVTDKYKQLCTVLSFLKPSI
jgi:hypothetical protein